MAETPSPLSSAQRRFPRPWTVREVAEAFVVEDRNGVALSYTYFIDPDALGTAAAGRLNRHEARRIATFFARAPDLVAKQG